MTKVFEKLRFGFLFSGLFALAACRQAPVGTAPQTPLPAEAQGLSLLGEVLLPPPLAPEERERREAALLHAKTNLERAPDEADAWLWYGRRLAYLGRFREAIDHFTQGIERFPIDPRFFRHRGHRWITLRDFAAAERDLSRAAVLARGRPDEIEPSGLPNSRGIDLSTRDQELYYHLGLAHFLAGNFEAALPAWRRCVELSRNPDSVCSGTTWLYATLRRLKREEAARSALAPIHAQMDIAEYKAYHRLLLAYKGELDPAELWERTRAEGSDTVDCATIGFGLGNFYACSNDEPRALEIWQQVAANPNWHAFGRIAAEVELARRGRR
jgi:tetratricopeptide (TPR) repeat protein